VISSHLLENSELVQLHAPTLWIGCAAQQWLGDVVALLHRVA
jgi:hypothetical protein